MVFTYGMSKYILEYLDEYILEYLEWYILEYLDEWKHINLKVMFSVSVSFSVFSIPLFSFLLSLSTLDPFNLCCDVVSMTLYYQM